MHVKWLVYTVVLIVALLAQAVARDEQPYSFWAEDLNSGERLSLNSLSKGKPLVLLTWAEDCPHCMRHMPYFAALIKELDPERVQVATMAMKGKERTTRDYIDKRGLDYIVLWAPGGSFDSAYEKAGWPTTFVFHAGGELLGIAEKTGQSYVREVEDMVEQALAAMPEPAAIPLVGPVVGMDPAPEEEPAGQPKPEPDPAAEPEPVGELGAPPIPPDRPIWPMPPVEEE